MGKITSCGRCVCDAPGHCLFSVVRSIFNGIHLPEIRENRYSIKFETNKNTPTCEWDSKACVRRCPHKVIHKGPKIGPMYETSAQYWVTIGLNHRVLHGVYRSVDR